MSTENASGTSRNKLVAVAFLVSSLALGVALGLVLYMGSLISSTPEPTVNYPIVVSSNLLDFGTVPLKGSAVRYLVLRNDGEEPVNAEFSTSGPYAVEPQSLILHPGINSRVSVSVKVDTLGDLTEELRIKLDESEEALVIALHGSGDVLKPEPVDPRSLRTAAEPAAVNVADASIAAPSAPERSKLPTYDERVAAEVRSTAAADAAARERTAQDATAKPTATTSPSADATKTTRRQDSRGSDDAATDRNGSDRRVVSTPYIAGQSPAIIPLSQRPQLVSDAITNNDRDRAARLPSSTGSELPDTLPDDDFDIDDERAFGAPNAPM